MMSKRAGELLDKCLEGTANPQEEAELLDLASASSTIKEYILEIAEVDAALHALTYDKDAFVDRVMTRITRSEARQNFTTRMLDKLQQKPADKFEGCILPYDEELEKQPSMKWMKAIFYCSAAAVVILLGLLTFQGMWLEEIPQLQVTTTTGSVTIDNGNTTVALISDAAVETPGIIRTGADSSTRLQFADGTSVEIGQFSEVAVYPNRVQKRIDVRKGIVRGSITPQLEESPMIFRGDNTEAVVLGTELVFARGPNAVLLQVTEGKVRLHRYIDSKEEAILVETGQVSVAERGSPLLRAVARSNFADRALSNVLNGLPTSDLLRINPDGSSSSSTFFAGQTVFGFDPNGQLDAPLLAGTPVADFDLEKLQPFRKEMKHTAVIHQEGELPAPWTVDIPDTETIGVVTLEKDPTTNRNAFSLRNIAGRASVQLTTWKPYELASDTSYQFAFSYMTAGNAALRFRYQINGVEQNPVILPPTKNEWRTYAVYLETENEVKAFRPIFQNVGIGRENTLYINDLNLISIPATTFTPAPDNPEYFRYQNEEEYFDNFSW